MILITFADQVTWELDDLFHAECLLEIHYKSGIPVEKLRCDDASDYIAINNYIELLILNIQ
jgi:hypothetical protein|tara:strand:- start:1869 stop:2051 length:183 start_codon:yes stop_codon:yes gene_type:complete